MIDPALVLPQWNRYTCGPAALRAALLCYGDRVDGRRLATLAQTDLRKETDEDQLRVAAKEFGFRIGHVLHRDCAGASAECLGLLQHQTPILLCVDSFSHWITAVKGKSRHVWIVDPARDEGENFRRTTWRDLLRRVHWGLPDEIRFDLYPVVPE